MLNKDTIKSAILSALTQASQMTEDPAAAREMIATVISNGIHAYTLAADVNPGIPVATTGSATAHTGQTTAKGSLS